MDTIKYVDLNGLEHYHDSIKSKLYSTNDIVTIVKDHNEVYVGSETPSSEDVKIWINPSGSANNFATEDYVDNAIQTAITTALTGEY